LLGTSVREAPARRGLEAPVAETLHDAFADEASFDAWYELTLPRVYGYVFARCGRDHDLAEELTQVTFIEAVRHRASFAGRSDPVTWLCSIARHKLADHYRHLDSEERRHLRLVERTRDCDGDGSIDGLPVEEREVITRALATLPALQRAVLVFTALDGLSVREAAALLDRSESATESLLHRARAAFRRAYAEEGGRRDV
jgi:RNA polymerase sigma-70 factor (ECF subfamily)